MEYGWTEEYIFKKLTWIKFWNYYEYAKHYATNGEYVIDWEEPQALQNAEIRPDGARVISK